MLILAIMLALLVVLVIVVIAGLALRAGRGRRARQGNWDERALDACSAADSLHDQLLTRLESASQDGAAPPAWSAAAERELEQLTTRLHALRFSAPNYTTDQATEELILALAAVRLAMQMQHGAPTVSSRPAGEPVSTARARLMELDSAVRALRAAV